MSQQRKLTRTQAAAGVAEVSDPNSAPVTRKFISRPDGSTMTQLAIDITSLPPPERRYSADDVRVTYNGADAVQLAFVQNSLTGVPRSLVAVKMYSDSARRFHEMCMTVEPSLQKFAEKVKLGLKNEPRTWSEPRQSVSLVATFAQVAFSGYEAEMSFYHVSPYSLHRAGQLHATSVNTEPVVQVDMSTGTLLYILHELTNIVGQLPGMPEDEP